MGMTIEKSDVAEISGESKSLPLDSGLSYTNFAVFGDVDRQNTIYIRSGAAPLELLGKYPLENIEISPGGRFEYFLNLLTNFSGKSFSWVMSLPVKAAVSESVAGRLVFVWEGLSNHEARSHVKTVLDRNAVDIKTAALRGDLL